VHGGPSENHAITRRRIEILGDFRDESGVLAGSRVTGARTTPATNTKDLRDTLSPLPRDAEEQEAAMTLMTMLTTTRMLQRRRLQWTMTRNLATMSPWLGKTWTMSATPSGSPPWTLRPTSSLSTLAKLGRDHRFTD
jgi:hypothetical protein